MNREETRKAAEVMMHFADGGEIECRTKSGGSNKWIAPSAYSWNWDEVEYRIKPRTVEINAWAVVSKSGALMSTWTSFESACTNAELNRCSPSSPSVVKLTGVATCQG